MTPSGGMMRIHFLFEMALLAFWTGAAGCPCALPAPAVHLIVHLIVASQSAHHRRIGAHKERIERIPLKHDLIHAGAQRARRR